MERINYPDIIEKVIQRHTGNDLEQNTEVQVLIDREHRHYQVLPLGWIEEEQVRVYACIVHIDLKDNQIWIQRDRTEIGVANELLEMGVPEKDIILGFHAPYKRRLLESLGRSATQTDSQNSGKNFTLIHNS